MSDYTAEQSDTERRLKKLQRTGDALVESMLEQNRAMQNMLAGLDEMNETQSIIAEMSRQIMDAATKEEPGDGKVLATMQEMLGVMRALPEAVANAVAKVMAADFE